MTWARVIGYAVGVLGAACLAVLLGGSPAAADGSDNSLLSSAGSGLVQLDRTVEKTVEKTVPDTLRGLAQTERRVTDEVRAVVHEVAPVPVVTDTVDQVTAVVDDTTSEVSEQVSGQVDEAPAAVDPVEDRGPVPAPAELVAQPHAGETLAAEPAAPRRTTGRAERTAPSVLEQVPVESPSTARAAEDLVRPAPSADILPDEQAAPATTPDVPTDGAGSVDAPSVSGLATLGGSARLPTPAHLDVLTRDRSVHASPPHRPGFSPD